MRLTPEQARTIVEVTRREMGAGVRVRLFGSRTRDDLRGGDIDLLVQSPHALDRPVWLATRITAGLQRALGDRRFDVLVVDPNTPLEPVHRVALDEGIELT